MPITFPFFLFAKAGENALRWIRIDRAPPLPDDSQADAQRKIAEALPPHLRRDVMRDE